MKKKFVLLFIYCFVKVSFPQSVELFGDCKPGNIVFGKSENIKSIRLDDRKVLFDSTGSFVFGFDRDAKGKHYLIVQLIYKTFNKKIILSKRKYKIQIINRIKKKICN